MAMKTAAGNSASNALGAISRGPRFLFLPGFDVFGRVAGILALAISIVHPTVEAYRDFRQAPSTVVLNSGSELTLVYDPLKKAFDFTFPVVLRNDGTRDDLLSSASVSLAIAEDSPRSLSSENVSVMTVDDNRVGLPLPVAKGSTQLFLAARTSFEPQQLSALLRNAAGRLILTLQAENSEPYTLQYCFYMTPSKLAEVLGSRRLERVRFLAADKCEDSRKLPT